MDKTLGEGGRIGFETLFLSLILLCSLLAGLHNIGILTLLETLVFSIVVCALFSIALYRRDMD